MYILEAGAITKSATAGGVKEAKGASWSPPAHSLWGRAGHPHSEHQEGREKIRHDSTSQQQHEHFVKFSSSLSSRYIVFLNYIIPALNLLLNNYEHFKYFIKYSWKCHSHWCYLLLSHLINSYKYIVFFYMPATILKSFKILTHVILHRCLCLPLQTPLPWSTLVHPALCPWMLTWMDCFHKLPTSQGLASDELW